MSNISPGAMIDRLHMLKERLEGEGRKGKGNEGNQKKRKVPTQNSSFPFHCTYVVQLDPSNTSMKTEGTVVWMGHCRRHSLADIASLLCGSSEMEAYNPLFKQGSQKKII